MISSSTKVHWISTRLLIWSKWGCGHGMTVYSRGVVFLILIGVSFLLLVFAPVILFSLCNAQFQQRHRELSFYIIAGICWHLHILLKLCLQGWKLIVGVVIVYAGSFFCVSVSFLCINVYEFRVPLVLASIYFLAYKKMHLNPCNFAWDRKTYILILSWTLKTRHLIFFL